MTAFMKETTKIQGQESDAEETMLKDMSSILENEAVKRKPLLLCWIKNPCSSFDISPNGVRGLVFSRTFCF